MAITLDATVGGANANTYIGLSDANSFIEGLSNKEFPINPFS